MDALNIFMEPALTLSKLTIGMEVNIWTVRTRKFAFDVNVVIAKFAGLKWPMEILSWLLLWQVVLERLN